MSLLRHYTILLWLQCLVLSIQVTLQYGRDTASPVHTTSQCQALSSDIRCFEMAAIEIIDNIDSSMTTRRKSRHHTYHVPTRVDVRLTAFNHTMHLEMRINDDVLPPTARINHVLPPTTRINHVLPTNIESLTAADFDVRYYTGRLADDVTSFVHGVLSGGTFQGTVVTSNQTYYIDHASNYPDVFNPSTSASVVFRESDVIPTHPRRCKVFIPDAKLVKGLEVKQPRRRTKKKRAKRQTEQINKICPVDVTVDYSAMSEIGLGNNATAIQKYTYVVAEVSRRYQVSNLHPRYRIRVQISQITLLYVSTTWSDESSSDKYLRGFLMYNKFTYKNCGAVAFTKGGHLDNEGLAYGRTMCTNANKLVVCGSQPTEIASTFMHELGHVVGAACHDDSTELGATGPCRSYGFTTQNIAVCAPHQADGTDSPHQYVMYPTWPEEITEMYWTFSPCSIIQILNYTTPDKYTFCMLDYVEPTVQTAPPPGAAVQPQPPKSVCGNGIIESGEQCDCGSVQDCSLPSTICCDGASCQYKTSFTICRVQSGCLNEARCGEPSQRCPAPQPVEPGRLCAMGKSHCEDGHCVGICTENDFVDCECNFIDCRVCCKCESTGVCLPSDWLNITTNRLDPMYYPVGKACRNKAGQCSIDHKCVSMQGITLPDRVALCTCLLLSYLVILFQL